MMKHLLWIPWVFALLILGIAICIGLIVYMLLNQPETAYHAGAYLVKGAVAVAAIA